MPIHLSVPRRGTLALATMATFALAAGSAQAGVPVELTVVDSTGSILADYTQYTDENKIKTDPGADCLGAAGSGDRVPVAGPTALSAVVDGAAYGDSDLRPVSLTDDTGFGLGVCGIGGKQAPSTGFWYLKQNRVESQTGGDQTRVERGDQITWYLDPDFSDAPPAELELVAPERTVIGQPVEVQVFQYDSTGTRTPAEGVQVTAASSLTNAEGKTTITPTTAIQQLQATRAGAISDSSSLCSAGDVADCPEKAPSLFGGSRYDDRITDTDGGDGVSMGPGDDRVNTRDRFIDTVNCGGGKDVAKVDGKDEVAKNCEKVLD
jgi:hypothetical protein